MDKQLRVLSQYDKVPQSPIRQSEMIAVTSWAKVVLETKPVSIFTEVEKVPWLRAREISDIHNNS